MEVIIALVLMGLVATNVSVDTKAPQEIKSVSTSIDANKAVKPNVKPKKKKAVKKVNVDPAKQQPAKELAKKETVKSEPVKPEPTPTVSLPEQKSKQSNLFYYILGFLTLGATAAYFYFRKKSQTTDTKIYTSDELKQSLQQDSDKFKYQPPEQKTIIEPQSQPSSSDQTSADPKPDDESKKS
ncbi:MAG: hypothetical protein NTY78_05525 [Pelagibacterales bacterium]|nr:hypothetical protein [Pelagibacterales bacterium]